MGASIKDLLNRNRVRWMDAGPDCEIVISSRVRLARNLRLVPFSHLLDSESGKKCLNTIKDAWKKSQHLYLQDMVLATFDELSPNDRQILVEKHLISPGHANADAPYRGLLVKDDGSVSIMINEEDHLRIQYFLPGLQLEECYNRAQTIDDELERNLDFAFDENRGYLTSCPTNVGTGMRASVMLHLPAIVISGHTGRIFHNIAHLGMTVRGIYGEGTEAIGNLFQLSNQVTLGQTESDIRNNLSTITAQIVNQEKALRDKLRIEMKYQLEDRIGRAYGILTNARMITSKEAMGLISDVRLGVDMGVVRDIDPLVLNELLVAIRPAHLQKLAGRNLESLDRDVKRATVIKEMLLSK
ncbi:MAG: protein arginine kinase [Syntrophomonadaceae bacterium]|jgi:protein arginine kinase